MVSVPEPKSGPKPTAKLLGPAKRTFLVRPAHASSGENSRRKVQNVKADRTVAHLTCSRSRPLINYRDYHSIDYRERSHGWSLCLVFSSVDKL